MRAPGHPFGCGEQSFHQRLRDPVTGQGPKRNRELRRLYEDNHCLAVFKPAGLLTVGDRTGDLSLVDLVRDDLKKRYRKPGNVFVGVVHRLDRPVAGIVLFARTSKAASRLSEQFRTHRVQKTYQALVEGRMRQSQGELVNRLIKDRTKNIVLRRDYDGPRIAGKLVGFQAISDSRRRDAFGNRAADRTQPSDPSPARRRRTSHRGRSEVWLDALVSGRDCPARCGSSLSIRSRRHR